MTQLANLVVWVLQANNVLAADTSGTSDPFTVVSLDNTVAKNKIKGFQTEVHPKTLNPEWKRNHCFYFQDIELKGRVKFSLFDKDKFTASDPLGNAYLTLDSNTQMNSFTVKTMNLTEIPEASGTISIAFYCSRPKTLLEGFLQKSGEKHTKMKKRFFTLTNVLTYSKSKKNSLNFLGYIPLFAPNTLMTFLGNNTIKIENSRLFNRNPYTVQINENLYKFVFCCIDPNIKFIQLEKQFSGKELAQLSAAQKEMALSQSDSSHNPFAQLKTIESPSLPSTSTSTSKKSKKSTSTLPKDGINHPLATQYPNWGYIQISNCKGRNLPQADTFGAIDAYIQFKAFGQTEKTKPISKCFNPDWGKSLTLCGELKNDTVLTAQLFDKDVGSADDAIGDPFTLKLNSPNLDHTFQFQAFSEKNNFASYISFDLQSTIYSSYRSNIQSVNVFVNNKLCPTSYLGFIIPDGSLNHATFTECFQSWAQPREFNGKKITKKNLKINWVRYGRHNIIIQQLSKQEIFEKKAHICFCIQDGGQTYFGSIPCLSTISRTNVKSVFPVIDSTNQTVGYGVVELNTTNSDLMSAFPRVSSHLSQSPTHVDVSVSCLGGPFQLFPATLRQFPFNNPYWNTVNAELRKIVNNLPSQLSKAPKSGLISILDSMKSYLSLTLVHPNAPLYDAYQSGVSFAPEIINLFVKTNNDTIQRASIQSLCLCAAAGSKIPITSPQLLERLVTVIPRAPLDLLFDIIYLLQLQLCKNNSFQFSKVITNSLIQRYDEFTSIDQITSFLSFLASNLMYKPRYEKDGIELASIQSKASLQFKNCTRPYHVSQFLRFFAIVPCSEFANQTEILDGFLHNFKNNSDIFHETSPIPSWFDLPLWANRHLVFSLAIWINYNIPFIANPSDTLVNYFIQAFQYNSGSSWFHSLVGSSLVSLLSKYDKLVDVCKSYPALLQNLNECKVLTQLCSQVKSPELYALVSKLPNSALSLSVFDPNPFISLIKSSNSDLVCVNLETMRDQLSKSTLDVPSPQISVEFLRKSCHRVIDYLTNLSEPSFSFRGSMKQFNNLFHSPDTCVFIYNNILTLITNNLQLKMTPKNSSALLLKLFFKYNPLNIDSILQTTSSITIGKHVIKGSPLTLFGLVLFYANYFKTLIDSSRLKLLVELYFLLVQRCIETNISITQPFDKNLVDEFVQGVSECQNTPLNQKSVFKSLKSITESTSKYQSNNEFLKTPFTTLWKATETLGLREENKISKKLVTLFTLTLSSNNVSNHPAVFQIPFLVPFINLVSSTTDKEIIRRSTKFLAVLLKLSKTSSPDCAPLTLTSNSPKILVNDALSPFSLLHVASTLSTLPNFWTSVDKMRSQKPLDPHVVEILTELV